MSAFGSIKFAIVFDRRFRDLTERYILELTVVGRSLKVAAIDETTGVEVSFVAPAGAPRADIERLALAKLTYVQSRPAGGELYRS